MNAASPTKCPKCGQDSSGLVDISSEMRLQLQNYGHGAQPLHVCSSCYKELANRISPGERLRRSQQVKESNRHMLWKGRVNLIKSARQMMQQKSYSHAVVSYEKYLRVLEISYDLKPGQLSPKVFGNSSRSKELTIIASTYWDLFRIYDAFPQHRSRMQIAGSKLAEFIPYSPLYSNVIKQAQEFLKEAKNPDLVRDLIKKSKTRVGNCFIATAAFNGVDHIVVLELRYFRDEYLLNSDIGAAFVSIYYKFSPHIARLLERSSLLCAITRIFLKSLNFFIKKIFI